ncbi:MAG: helix-turn-helix domain-containing protein [Kofleriaceae bacterium]
MPARPPISILPFDPSSKRTLGFDMFKLSSLYERAHRRVLSHTLETPQRPEFHTIYVGLKGRGELIVDFESTPIGCDFITVVARGRVQQFHQPPKSGLDAWMLLFTPEFIEVPSAADPLAMPSILWPLDRAPALHVEPSVHDAILQTTEQLHQERARTLDRFQPLILSSLLRSILLRLERAIAWHSPLTHLRRFFTILERDFARTREVNHYAREAGVSRRRLSELAHEELGRSPKQLIDERVILEHKRLLAHTNSSVKELAALTGFDEPTNLVKFFRLHTGQTPLEFRGSHLGVATGPG